MRFKFYSWLLIGILAAFLVVASASFSLSVIAWLALAISAVTGIISVVLAYSCRDQIVSFGLAAGVTLGSAWTVVASLAFSHSTVQNLALAGGLAIGVLAVGGLSVTEVSLERVVQRVEDDSDKGSRLAAAV